MSKALIKVKAFKLRRQGMSVGAISSFLKVSKSTVSVWCREISLSEDQIRVLKEKSILSGNKGRMIGAEMNRKKKIDAIKRNLIESEEMIGNLSSRDLLLSGISLYWAEGSKSDSTSGFVFVNSDPEMILFMKIFLEKVLNVNKCDFLCTVQINKVHEPRIAKVLKFWSNLLQLSPEQFTKTYYIKLKPNKIYENYDNYYGVLRLKVRKSTNLKYKMLGLIKALKSDLSR